MGPALADERMSDVDAVVWAVESESRLRTTIAALALVDGPLPHGELRHRVERLSRVIPRLRQRVVADPLGIVAPRWSLDPDFALAFHLRCTRLGGGGTDRDLLDLVQELIVQPFDRSRPLWELTLIEGLTDGRSAVLIKSHHAVSDGVGGVELMLELFDLQPEPTAGRLDLPPTPLAPTPGSPTIAETAREETVRNLRSARRWLEGAAAASSADLVGTARRLGQTIGSAGRLFGPGPALRSPLMRGRSAGLAAHMFDVELQALRAAGARVGGTINDAFVAGIVIGVADHHLANDVKLAGLRVSIPINTRVADDGVGNHWTPGRIDLSTADSDPDTMMRVVRDAVARLRGEPAQVLLDPLTAMMRRLPSAATAALFSALSSGIDIVASNVPGTSAPLHLCGAELTALVPFGPLSGSAANITLLSHAEAAHIGVVTDPAAVPDAESFKRCIEVGMASVVKGS